VHQVVERGAQLLFEPAFALCRRVVITGSKQREKVEVKVCRVALVITCLFKIDAIGADLFSEFDEQDAPPLSRQRAEARRNSGSSVPR
jgi:hypothetical protein